MDKIRNPSTVIWNMFISNYVNSATAYVDKIGVGKIKNTAEEKEKFVKENIKKLIDKYLGNFLNSKNPIIKIHFYESKYRTRSDCLKRFEITDAGDLLRVYILSDKYRDVAIKAAAKYMEETDSFILLDFSIIDGDLYFFKSNKVKCNCKIKSIELLPPANQIQIKYTDNGDNVYNRWSVHLRTFKKVFPEATIIKYFNRDSTAAEKIFGKKKKEELSNKPEYALGKKILSQIHDIESDIEYYNSRITDAQRIIKNKNTQIDSLRKELKELNIPEDIELYLELENM